MIILRVYFVSGIRAHGSVVRIALANAHRSRASGEEFELLMQGAHRKFCRTPAVGWLHGKQNLRHQLKNLYIYAPLTLPTMLGFDYYTSLCSLCLLCLLCLLCSTVMVVSADSLFFYLKGLRLQSGVYLRASLTLLLRRVAGAVKALGGAPGG